MHLKLASCGLFRYLMDFRQDSFEFVVAVKMGDVAFLKIRRTQISETPQLFCSFSSEVFGRLNEVDMI